MIIFFCTAFCLNIAQCQWIGLLFLISCNAFDFIIIEWCLRNHYYYCYVIILLFLIPMYINSIQKLWALQPVPIPTHCCWGLLFGYNSPCGGMGMVSSLLGLQHTRVLKVWLWFGRCSAGCVYVSHLVCVLW